MGWKGLSVSGIAALHETAGAGICADLSGARRVRLGEAGRRCATEGCGQLLARLTPETICYACQSKAADDEKLAQQAAPVSGVEAVRGYSSAVALRGRRRPA